MNVYQAINAVQAELCKEGIAKDGRATGFGAGYNFRGIDAVYNALSPILAKHGLVIIPRCLERHESMRETTKSKLYFVCVKMEFDFVSSEDGSKHTACTYGEAMDSGDKATNKAMSIAYKYACFQAFAIPTEGDNDPDATVHAPAPSRPQPAKQQKDARSFDEMLVGINKSDLGGLTSIGLYLRNHKASYSKDEMSQLGGAFKAREELLKAAATAQAE